MNENAWLPQAAPAPTEATFGVKMKSIPLTAVIRGTWSLLTLSPLDWPQSYLSSEVHILEASELEVGFLLHTVRSN